MLYEITHQARNWIHYIVTVIKKIFKQSSINEHSSPGTWELTHLCNTTFLFNVTCAIGATDGLQDFLIVSVLCF